MSDYKFRGKRIDGSGWVCGDLIRNEWNSYIRPESKDLKFPLYRGIDLAEVHPESVGMSTGLKDKNGVDVYEGDIVKVKMKYMEKDFEADYRVDVSIFKGMSLCIVKSITPECTYHCSIQWENGGLCTAYVDAKYDRIAMHRTEGRNRMQRTSWVEQEYSEDIEVIGNATDNPDLIGE